MLRGSSAKALTLKGTYVWQICEIYPSIKRLKRTHYTPYPHTLPLSLTPPPLPTHTDLPATDLPCSSASTPVYLAILGTGAIDPMAAMAAIEDNSFASVFTQPSDFCATKFIQFQPVPFR